VRFEGINSIPPLMSAFSGWLSLLHREKKTKREVRNVDLLIADRGGGGIVALRRQEKSGIFLYIAVTY
jgi:hypothetical protein